MILAANNSFGVDLYTIKETALARGKDYNSLYVVADRLCLGRSLPNQRANTKWLTGKEVEELFAGFGVRTEERARKWTDEDKAFACEMFHAGMTLEGIAYHLNTTGNDLRKLLRLCHLKLSPGHAPTLCYCGSRLDLHRRCDHCGILLGHGAEGPGNQVENGGWLCDGCAGKNAQPETAIEYHPVVQTGFWAVPAPGTRFINRAVPQNRPSDPYMYLVAAVVGLAVLEARCRNELVRSAASSFLHSDDGKWWTEWLDIDREILVAKLEAKNG